MANNPAKRRLGASLLEVPIKALLIAGLLSVTAGCAGHATVTGQERSPIDPDDVTLYEEPPAQYEVVGIVEAWSGTGLFLVAASKTHVRSKLKKEAAKIGANGVIDWSIWDEERGFSFNPEEFGSSTASRAVGKGKAIYVPLDKQSE